MSMVIFGKIMDGGPEVGGLVDDNNDNPYFIDGNEKYFIRAAQVMNDEDTPALALFSDEHPYELLYGKVLDKDWSAYFDSCCNETEEFKTCLELVNYPSLK